MSGDVTVLVRTQVIEVNEMAGIVAVVNAGPQGPAGAGATTLEPRVEDLEDADTVHSADIATLTSGKVSKAGDTMTGQLILPGSPGFKLGGTTVTETVESGIKHFTVDGVFHNFHPVIFRSPLGLVDHNGTLSGGASGGLTNGVPRITFAKPGTKTMKWFEEAPAGWDNMRTSFCWLKEASGSGNVHWRISVQIMNFLSGTVDMDSGTMSTVYDAGVAVPATQGNGLYTITSGSYVTTPQAFGIPPVLSCALQRIDDGTDTFAGAVSVAFLSTSFI